MNSTTSIKDWNSLTTLTEKQEEFILSLEKTKSFDIFQTYPNNITPKEDQNNDTFLPSISEIEEEDQKFQQKLIETKYYHEKCDNILQKIDAGLNYLKLLENHYISVSKKTGELHQACKSLVEEQTELVKITDDIQKNLLYFDEFPAISKRLSGNLRVYDEDFSETLNKVDDCIQFIKANDKFKDSENFLKKYNALLIRALKGIKDEILSNLKSTTLNSLSSSQKDENPEILFYIKFKSLSQKLKPLILFLEQRNSTKEFSAMLKECHIQYLSQRKILLTKHIEKQLDEIPSKHTELSHIIQESCQTILDISKSEFSLFQNFFSLQLCDEKTIFEISESFVNLLYLKSRPKYLRSHNIEDLSNLIYLLSVEISNEENLSRKFSEPIVNSILRMTQDIQERLIFLSENFLQAEILGFQPNKEDLNYPEKLKENYQFKDNNLEISNSVLPIKRSYPTWYPTLEKTVVCLSKLYLALSNNKKTFEGIATEAINSCSNSLLEAQKKISDENGILHGNLFLLKHLSTLRKQISPFKVNFQTSETIVDYSTLRNSFRNLFRIGRETTLVSALSQSMPQLEIHQLDSKKDLENSLKNTINRVVLSITKILLENVISFITKSQAFLSIKKKNLSSENFAQINQVLLLLEETKTGIIQKIPENFDLIDLYISENQTCESVKNLIIEQTFDTLNQFRNLISTHYEVEDSMKVFELLEDLKKAIEILSKRNENLDISRESLNLSFTKENLDSISLSKYTKE